MTPITQPHPPPRPAHRRLRFTLAAEAPASLPPYLGSLLRGAFGHALRRVGCEAGSGSCSGSDPEHRACPYPRLFEPFAGRRRPFLAGEPVAPRPYLFEPRSRGGELRTGDRLEFDLLLIGSARDLQDPAVEAVREMARTGLGADRRAFRLIETSVAEAAPGPEAPPGDAELRRLTLRWLTPVRLISGGRRLHRLPVEELVDRAVQRLAALAHLFDDGPEPREGDREPWRAAARAVQVERSELRWLDLHRYSNRQRRRHALGGLVGEMRLRGDLAPLRKLLQGIEIFHVGKGTTFGLGRLEVVRDSANLQDSGAVLMKPRIAFSRADPKLPGKPRGVAANGSDRRRILQIQGVAALHEITVKLDDRVAGGSTRGVAANGLGNP